MLGLWLIGNDAYLQAAIEGRGDPLEHGERMPLVVGVLKLRNDGLLGVDKLGELFLSEAGAGSGIVDRLSDKGADRLLLDHLSKFGVIAHNGAIDDFESVRGLAGFAGW